MADIHDSDGDGAAPRPPVARPDHGRGAALAGAHASVPGLRTGVAGRRVALPALRGGAADVSPTRPAGPRVRGREPVTDNFVTDEPELADEGIARASLVLCARHLFATEQSPVTPGAWRDSSARTAPTASPPCAPRALRPESGMRSTTCSAWRAPTGRPMRTPCPASRRPWPIPPSAASLPARPGAPAAPSPPHPSTGCDHMAVPSQTPLRKGA